MQKPRRRPTLARLGTNKASQRPIRSSTWPRYAFEARQLSLIHIYWGYDKIEEEIKKCKEKYGPNSLTVLTGTGREAGRYMTNTSARVCVTTNQCYTQTGFSCMAPRDTVCSMIGGAGYIEYDFANGLPRCG